jgi:DNA topoisomerase-2
MPSKTIEEKYKKHEHREHILKRPDSVIGSIEKDKSEVYCVNKDGNIEREIVITSPGLYKIFDELVVNTYDFKQRMLETPKAHQVTEIKVDIDKEKNEITVYNNGEGIDIALHKEHGIYVPELIFGQLLTSTNYDDDEERTVGGKNGYGAKATNIFSTKFIVETVDFQRSLKYKQIFRDNMSVIEKPKIKEYVKNPYTKITFYPDLEKFGMQELEDDMIKLMERRVYDLAACVGKNTSVYLNGKKIAINSFEKYINMYIGTKKETKRAYELVNDRWEVCVCVSPDDKPEQVSFVNSINTLKGGKHVDMIANQIAKRIIKNLESKKKTSTLKASHIKDNLWIFVKAIIVNPSFDTQTKETLTTPSSKFGSVCELSDNFIKDVCKTDILEKAQMLNNYKSKSVLSKTDGKKKNKISGIPKLDDAKYAGTVKSKNCTLILTEGDSAKALAIAGLSVVGRDYFGVFPLKGKLLNVRDASDSQKQNNLEINNLKKIIGLQQYETGTNKPKKYENIETLRYGHVLLLCDADVDGYHIMGLVMNFFATYWPSLLKIPDFIQTLATPIVKIKKGKKEKQFYTLSDYENWKDDEKDSEKWKTKYYKGLGTSTSVEAREYFTDYKNKVQNYYRDSKKDDNALSLAFDKKRANDRKKWLKTYDKNNIISPTKKDVKYEDFVDNVLIHFSIASNVRAIPSICDGLKPSQRKIIYSVMKKNLKDEMKVSQLAGYISEQSDYHHGEASLYSTIVGMAQNYVGSNNINLLEPRGQFGTRAENGKNSASPRYINTMMSKMLQLLFKIEDNVLLNYLDSDGVQIEPEWYVPVLPLVLINGCEGIGTGYSTNIPKYNPLDIIEQIYTLMDNKESVLLNPWYRGFNGDISKIDNSFTSSGKYKVLKKDVVEITELPVCGKSINDYKAFLEKEIAKDNPVLKSYDDENYEHSVKFILHFHPGKLKIKNFEKDFKINVNISTSNMTLHDRNGNVKKYSNTNEILKEFYDIRLEYYIKRRKVLKKKLKEELQDISEKVRFIWKVVKEELLIFNKSDEIINEQLVNFEFKMKNDSYDYLISMPLRSLTEKKIKELEKIKDKKENEYKLLKNKTPIELWKDDIEEFKKGYVSFLKDFEDIS